MPVNEWCSGGGVSLRTNPDLLLKTEIVGTQRKAKCARGHEQLTLVLHPPVLDGTSRTTIRALTARPNIAQIEIDRHAF
jgi:hypothetical protein